MIRRIFPCLLLMALLVGPWACATNRSWSPTESQAIARQAQIQRNIPYVLGGGGGGGGAGGASQSLDLYLPRVATAGPRPVIVWIHGGAWKKGDKQWVPGLPMLLSRGYAVVSVNYRLSAQAIWPAQLDDCRSALRWISLNADRLRLDSQRIGVWGESAGGHLAEMLGMGADSDAGPGAAPRVQAVCAWYAPAELGSLGIYSATMKTWTGDDAVAELLGGSIDQKQQEAADASPLTHVAAGQPPFLLMHGSADPVVPLDQSQQLAEALKKAGVPVELVVLDKASHCDSQFLQPATLNQVAAFFDKSLRLKATTRPVPVAADQSSPPGRNMMGIASSAAR